MTPVTNTLKRYAHKLRLSGLLGSLELRLQEAESHRLPYADFRQYPKFCVWIGFTWFHFLESAS